MLTLIDRIHEKRWAILCIVNLRILLGFAFLPSGLKKVLDQPFTDPGKTGAFHEFLHAFQATGFFYQFVGIVQLTIAVLLMTQTFSTLGALMALPVFTAIAVFCWSTQVVFTAVMVTLMLSGTIALVLWDHDKWRGVLHVGTGHPIVRSDARAPTEPLVDMVIWQRCGAAILVFYLASCAIDGGVYRPKGPDFDNPAFYILQAIALFPLITLAIEHRRRRQSFTG